MRLKGPNGISIHIPRVGDDGVPVVIQDDLGISIHIPRVGDDARMVAETGLWIVYFNPHPPCGG